MNISCPHCHRYFPVTDFTPGGVMGCPNCLRNVFLPSERIPDAFLIPLEGDAANNKIPLSTRMIVGRSNDADIQVLDSNISRQHAEIIYENGRFAVRDLGSRNGVIVNEARVGETPLNHMDVLRFGGRNFRFELAETAANATARSPQRAAPRGEAVPTTEIGRRLSPVVERGPGSVDQISAPTGPVVAPQPTVRTARPDVPGTPPPPPPPRNDVPADSLLGSLDSVLGNLSMFTPPPGASVILRDDPATAAAAAAMAAAQAANRSAPEAPPVPDSSPLDASKGAIRTQIDAGDIDQLAAAVGEGAGARAQSCLQTVYRVSEALAGVRDIDELLAKMLQQVLASVPADRAYVILKDDQDAFVVRAAQFREQRHADNQTMVSRTLLQRVVDQNVALLVADAQTEFQSQHSFVSQGIRSVMCVPLAIHHTSFGAISVDTLRSRNAFDDFDLRMLTAIGRQASVALENLRLLRAVEENARTRGILERYLPPELIEQVVQRKVDLKPGGQQAELTILFSDIRGFTQLAAGMEPTAVVELINEYFSIMVEVLFKHGATLDKFIGDSIMAFWGAPVKHDDDALRAVRCALEMQEKLAQFNELMKSSGQMELAVGIGINTGEAVAGNIGSMRRFEYTILGDAVNVASRLQALAQGGQIVISEATFAQLGGTIPGRELPPIELKGRSGLVKAFDVSKKL